MAAIKLVLNHFANINLKVLIEKKTHTYLWLRKPWNIYEVDIKQSIQQIQPLKTTNTICAMKQIKTARV